MVLYLSSQALNEIHALGEAAYPEEGAGLLLGKFDQDDKTVHQVLPMANAREDTARHNRYLVGPQDYLAGELEAERLGLEVLGVFHSHPDHPNLPSEFDRAWAIPWFSYLITSVQAGKAQGSRSWRLLEDRSRFVEEQLTVTESR